MLEKIGRKNILTQDELNKLVFKLNSNISLGGSALQRFFARDVGTYQPALMRRKLDHAALMQKKTDHQLKVAKKLGRRAVDEFKVGDAVVAQDIRTGKWTIRGTVTEGRLAEDGTTRSWVVETEVGRTTLRNSRHLKHQIRKSVTFADTDDYETSADEGHETSADDSMVTSEDGTQNKFVRFSARLAAALKQKHDSQRA